MGGAGFLGTWTAMMAGMMLPSTVPLLRLDYAAARSFARSAAIAGGYLSRPGARGARADRARRPLSWELTENCAFASRFAYASE
jgi:hypothetical protein